MAKKEDEVQLIAYSLWEAEGYPNGKDYEHWFRAETIWEEKQKPKSTPKSNQQIPKIANKVMPAKKKS